MTQPPHVQPAEAYRPLRPEHVPPARPGPKWYAVLLPGAGDVAAAARLVVGLLLAGIPVGLLWLALAPRREFQVAEQGAFAVEADSEAAVAGDGWFLLLTVAVAVVAAVLAWRWRGRRGPLMPAALAVGTSLCGALAATLGAALGSGPSAAELADVGTIVQSPLQLRAYGVLVVAPFVAVVGYLVAVCFTPRDDLDRPDFSPPGNSDLCPPGQAPLVGRAADHELGQGHRDGVQAADDRGLPPQQPGRPPQPLQG